MTTKNKCIQKKNCAFALKKGTRNTSHQCGSFHENVSRRKDQQEHHANSFNEIPFPPTEMAFFCRYCQREFRAKQQMEQHELIHEGKKYQCDICGKWYSNQANLCRHKNDHPFREEKSTSTMFSVCGENFVCGECCQYFRNDQKQEYQAHLARHHTAVDYGKIIYAKK